MKWLVIHSEDESTPEIRVPGDFKPVLIREYVGKKGEEVFSKDYLIDQDECTHKWETQPCGCKRSGDAVMYCEEHNIYAPRAQCTHEALPSTFEIERRLLKKQAEEHKKASEGKTHEWVTSKPHPTQIEELVFEKQVKASPFNWEVVNKLNEVIRKLNREGL